VKHPKVKHAKVKGVKVKGVKVQRCKGEACKGTKIQTYKVERSDMKATNYFNFRILIIPYIYMSHGQSQSDFFQ
jgi:hypothetical protein